MLMLLDVFVMVCDFFLAKGTLEPRDHTITLNNIYTVISIGSIFQNFVMYAT